MAVSNVTLPNGERVNISHEDDATELDVLNFAYSEYVTNTDPGSAFGRGIRDGVDLLQTSYGSTLEGIGSILDVESLKQVGADVVAEQRGQMDAEAFRQQRYGDQDEGIVDYALNLAGTSTPQMVPTAVGAVAGLKAGAAIGGTLGAGFFGIGAAPGAAIGSAIGAVAGGFLFNYPYFYGDNRERQKEAIERGFRTEIDEGAAALYAVPQSLLDAAFAGIGAKFLASGALKAGGGILTRATRGAVEGAVIEAPTELGQQFLNRYQAGLPIDSDEAKLEYMEAAKGGALLGGLFGGGGRAVFGNKEGADAMPESETEETVQMPPSVTTPEGEATSPEVEEILEGATGGTGSIFGLSREEVLRILNTPENVADLYPGQGFVTKEQADQHKADLAMKAKIEAELGITDFIDPGKPITDEEIQRALNTADTLEEQFPGRDSIRQEQMDQYRSDIENKKRVMQELDAAIQPDQQAFDESLINRPPPVEQDSMPTFTEEEFEARTRRSPDPLSLDATSDEVAEAVEGMLTAQEEAALEAEMQRELLGDISPEGPVPVDPVVEESEEEIDAKSRIAALQQRIDNERRLIKMVQDENDNFIKEIRESKILLKEEKQDRIKKSNAKLKKEVDKRNKLIGTYEAEMSGLESIVESAPATAPAQEVAFKIVPDINPTYDGPGGFQKKVLGYKVRAKDGKDYYIQSANYEQAPDLRFAVFNGLDPSLGDEVYLAGFPTKKAAVDFLREKKPEAAPAPAQEAAPEPTPTTTPTPSPQPEPVQEVDSEAVKEQQDTIDDAESRIADLQFEIDTEKSNIKEARDRNKKEIAAVRKSKLSKEDKADKIEDLKASLQDEVDEIKGNIGIYKEEMSGFKKDLRKAKKKIAGLQPKEVKNVTGEPEITSDEVLTDEQIQRGVESEQGATAESDIDGDVFVGASPFEPPVQGNAPIITRASLAGKKLFAYFSDRTRVGTYTGINPDSGINVELQGGPMYPFMGNNLEKKAGWAFSSEGMFTRFLNRVKKTDGVGLVTLYSKENLRANLTFLKAYVAEVNYAIKEGNITEQRFLEIANNLREAAVKSKKKTNKLLDKPFKSIKDFEKALAGATFDVRAAAFFGYNKNKKGDNKGSKIGADKLVEEGFPNISTMVDLFNDPSLDGLENGTIVSAVQFDQNQDGPSTATTLGVSEHTSYKVVIKGEGLGFFSDPVLVSDVIPSMGRPRRAVERSAETSMADVQFQQEVTAGTDTGPEIADIINEGKTFENAGQLDRFISAVFAPIARKLGVDIVANYSITRGLQYNVTQGVIEYNPVAVINNTREYLTAGMREELIHAAMHKVLINQNKGKNRVKVWVDFMTKLGQDLTQEQREALADVYNNLGNDMEFGAEYSRAVIQQSLYGDITEVYAKGKSFEKIKKLFRSIQGFVARTFGSEVSNPEVAGVIRASADLLKAVDPSVRPSNQVVVGAAMNNSVDLNPNSEITSQDVVEAGKPPSKRKIDLNFADKYLFTVSSVLGKIHPRLKLLIRDYYGLIQSKVLSYQTAMAPFFKKMRGIKNKEDLRRLKQLLMYSPMVADAGTAEQDALLAKYGMLEDYRNLVRPALDKLRADLVDQGVEVGDLFDYFPRRIKNFKALQAVKAAWGNTVGASFKDFIEARNKRILAVRSKMMDLNEELVKASDNNDQAGIQRISQQLKELSAQDNVIISVGSKETALQEAQEWDKFITQLSASNPDMLPGNVRERAMKGEIPDGLLQYYEDPAPAMESYIFNMVSASETVSLIGSRFVTNKEGTQMDQASKLGRLIQELRASGAIIDEQADRTIPEIMKLILSPKKGESRILQLARSLGYGTLLVEFTSTLSQLYDLPFIMLDNGFFPTLNAMFGSRLKGSAFGIDTEKISQEFAGDDKFLEKAVRLGLRSTGFTKLDQIMKETNLTANYRRYRKLANLYYKNRDSSQIKTFTAELTALGYSPEEQNQLIADLKKGDQDSALVRSLLFNKLAETQPLTSAEMAMGIVGNPNLRIAVAMKSFMVKQLVFTKDRMLADMFGPGRTNAQRLKASKDLAKLLSFMLLIGVPVDALKDLLAGRVGYLDDYLFDGVFRVAGVSRYTGYKIRSEGFGRAAFDYATPVAFQQAMDATGELQRVMSGERALSQSKFVAYAPYSDVINRMFGFQKVKERKTIKRKAAEGEFPLFIPPGAL